jgi:transposase
VKPELWAEIRRLALVEKQPGRVIARSLRVSPKTVRAALRSETVPTVAPRPRPSRVDPFVPRIEDLLARTPELSAVRVLEEIRKLGYAGSYSALKRRMRPLRPRRKEAFVPLRFEPGEAAQVDWASCGTITIGATVRRLSCFVLVLCHSRLLYLEFTVSEGLTEFLRCHVNAFRFLGGVPRRIIYDNLRSVVLDRAGAEVRFNPRFLDLAGHYLFRPDACRPRRPNEKGRVENAVRYIRESFLAGRDLRSLAEYELAARRWRDEVANVRLHATTGRRPVDLFAEEKPHLISLASREFDADAVEERKVSSLAFVSFDGNLYSVPGRLVGSAVTVRASAHGIRVLAEGSVVAEHARSYERGKEIEDALHRREILEAKRRAEESVETTRFLAIGPEAEAYLRGLVQSEHDHHRELRRILALLDAYGATEVLGAIVKALEFRAFGAAYLERIVSQERRRRAEGAPPGPVKLTTPNFAEVHIGQTDLAEYDRILGGPAATPERKSAHDEPQPPPPEPGEEPARSHP